MYIVAFSLVKVIGPGNSLKRLLAFVAARRMRRLSQFACYAKERCVDVCMHVCGRRGGGG